MATVTLPGGVVSLSAENADKLLHAGNGDAALLYLALLRHAGELAPARQSLGWSQSRLDGAYAVLQSAALVAPGLQSSPGPREDAPPEYAARDVVAALEGDGTFASLLRQVEQALGSKLQTQMDLRALLTIYDFLALPPEVILLLTTWCVEETERKYGPGRRPRMSVVKKEAFRWHDRGLDTLAAAEAFLRAQKRLAKREKALLPRLGIRDRAPLDKEREYIAGWVDMGFDDEAVVMAYQKTLLKKQDMNWPYMNSILKNWHAKGLHTPAEIKRGDSAPTEKSRTPDRRAKAPSDQTQVPTRNQERLARNIAALRRDSRKEQG